MLKRILSDSPPDSLSLPEGCQDQIKADLAAQLAAGGTLYGIRSDGAYVERTKDGDRILDKPWGESN